MSALSTSACHYTYVDLEVDTTSAYIQRMHERQQAKGATKITDYRFILDGKEYDVSFQQLKHALQVESQGVSK